MKKRIMLVLTLLMAVVAGAKAGKYDDALKDHGTITFDCMIYSDSASFEFTNINDSLSLTNRSGGEKGYYRAVTVSAILSKSESTITFHLDAKTLMNVFGDMEIVVYCKKDSIAYSKKSGYMELDTIVAVVPAHKHSYSSSWSVSETAHWHECTSAVGPCTALKSDSAAHTFGTEGEARYTCSVCDYVSSDKKAKIEADDKSAADSVIALIDAVIAKIEAIDVFADADTVIKDSIDSAQEAYDKLTADQKKLVSDEKTTAFANAKKAYDAKKTEADKAAGDKAAVDTVIAKIDAIGTVEYNETVKTHIEDARAAYDALSTDLQELVTNAKTLEEAEAAYAELVKNNTSHTVTIKTGTDDAAKWSITPTEGTNGTTVTVKYSGEKKVKSVKAVKVVKKAE